MKKDWNQIYTKDDILAQLSAMKLPRNKIVLAHSSLRLVGKLEEGPKTLLDALMQLKK